MTTAAREVWTRIAIVFRFVGVYRFVPTTVNVSRACLSELEVDLRAERRDYRFRDDGARAAHRAEARSRGRGGSRSPPRASCPRGWRSSGASASRARVPVGVRDREDARVVRVERTEVHLVLARGERARRDPVDEEDRRVGLALRVLGRRPAERQRAVRLELAAEVERGRDERRTLPNVPPPSTGSGCGAGTPTMNVIENALELLAASRTMPVSVCVPFASVPVLNVAVAPEIVGAAVAAPSSVARERSVSSLAVIAIWLALAAIEPFAGTDSGTTIGMKLSTRIPPTTLWLVLPTASLTTARVVEAVACGGRVEARGVRRRPVGADRRPGRGTPAGLRERHRGRIAGRRRAQRDRPGDGGARVVQRDARRRRVDVDGDRCAREAVAREVGDDDAQVVGAAREAADAPRRVVRRARVACDVCRNRRRRSAPAT